MTFAHKVVDYAAKQDFQVFFTGHSVGGWMAQITTFSTMHLALDEVTGHFIVKQLPHSHMRMPYTVVFDCPGAYEFLISLKKSLFRLQMESEHEINFKELPIEMFLFQLNPHCPINTQVGRVFTLDVPKVKLEEIRYFGVKSVIDLLNKCDNVEDTVDWRIIHHRVGMENVPMKFGDGWTLTKPSNTSGRSSVPLYFFNTEEQTFLKTARSEFPPEGQFEGVNWEDELTANDLVRFVNGKFCGIAGLHIYQSMEMSGDWDSREFIPRVRHTVKCLRQLGTLWWNPRSSTLPLNYINRRMSPTENHKDVQTAMLSSKPNFSAESFSPAEVQKQKERLVAFVDRPGMGLSSALTKLEIDLRSEITSSPRVIVRLNLARLNLDDWLVFHQRTYLENENALTFIAEFLNYVPVDLLRHTFPQGNLPLYVLLDEPDQSNPFSNKVIVQVIQCLLKQTPQCLFIVHKVILATTRPHIQQLIENQFQVKVNSLVTLEFREQVKYLKKQVGITFNPEKSLNSLPSRASCLMGSPLMLSLYAEVLKSRGAETVVNLFHLYAQFIEIKHERRVLENDNAQPSKQTPIPRMRSSLQENLKFYFGCAVYEILGSINIIRTSGKIWTKKRDLGDGFLELPTGKRLEELSSFGLLMNGNHFLHKSFANFFYAKLLTDEGTPSELKEALFGRLYNTVVPRNVESFVQDVLLERQENRSGWKLRFREGSSSSLGVLRGEEAVMFFGKERLARLVKGWQDSLSDKEAALEILIHNLKLHEEGKVEGFKKCSLIKEDVDRIQGELADVFDNGTALMNFYNGKLFPFVCGWSVLKSLGLQDSEILKSITTKRSATPESTLTHHPTGFNINNIYREGRQCALIVNIHTNRPGAEKDKEALQETLIRCGFELDVCQDLTKQGILAAVSQFRDKVGGIEQLGAVVVAVGSHGHEHGFDFFLSSDGDRLQVMGDFVDQFNGVNCRALQEVPKVFLINICRGNKVDVGKVESDSGWKSLDEWWTAKGPKKIQSDSIGNRWPTWSNMIVAFASYEGHKAYRDIERGTWFFQEFCAVIRSHARGMCIKAILDKVSEEVMRKTTEDGEKQMPTWMNVGFTRSLLFYYK